MSRRTGNAQIERLRRGREFHERVQRDWRRSATDGSVRVESAITLKPSASATHIRRGRIDLFVDDLGDFVSVVEIKSTDWDTIKPGSRRKLMGAHRRQTWRYIERYLDLDHMDVCPGLIYPRAPMHPGLRDEVEDYMEDYGLQVVWYDG